MKKALFLRHMAIGDLVFILPFVQEFLKAEPSYSPELLTDIDLFKPGLFHKIHLFRNLNSSLPEFEYEKLFLFHYEDHPNLHIQDAYSLSTGIRVQKQLLPFSFSSFSKLQAKRYLFKFGHNGKKIISVQLESASELRNYPLKKYYEFLNILKKKHPEFSILVFSSNPHTLDPEYVNFCGRIPDLNVLSYILSLSSFFIGPDSGLLHIARAFSVPSIALFGPTLPELRLCGTSNIRLPLHPSIDCFGCYHEQSKGKEEMHLCQKGRRACLLDLEPELIYKEFIKLLEGKEDLNLLERMQRYEIYKEKYLSDKDPEEERVRLHELYLKRIEIFFQNKYIQSKRNRIREELLNLKRIIFL
ncbi:MAG: hypothetical protein H7A25_01975 [Leptospiraceae bacterium]|nr:hypothetical protein [Leptospiraceae bacterium]MCP5498644.1 hypothetical protein [Leptospiraceae bacterium]